MESNGGIYALHSHLNHTCTPNISVRHLDTTQFTRLTIIAKAPIQPGEELSICYVNPEGAWRVRKRELRQWGFECRCMRCWAEERAEVEAELSSGSSSAGIGMDGLVYTNGHGVGVENGMMNGHADGNTMMNGRGGSIDQNNFGYGTVNQMDLEDELRGAFGM